MSFNIKPKRITVMICAVALAMSLAACHGPGESGNGTSAASDSGGAATAPWAPDTTTPETVDMSGRTALPKPTSASAALKYTGGELEFIPDGFDAALMDITGNKATAIGSYTATVSLLDTEKYAWEDETADPVVIAWTVSESGLSYDLSEQSGVLHITHPEGDTVYEADITLPTGASYSLDGDSGTLTFKADTKSADELTWTLAGSYFGALVFDAGENDIVIELAGFTLAGSKACPLYIMNAANADISAKKDTENYIYDKREAAEELKAAVYSECDLKLKGAGILRVISDSNNGIHTKDDMKVQKLTLYVSSVDNALKGNDGVTVSSGDITLISRQGDGIKTSDTSLSKKGNQKGSVTIESGIVNIYAACDGIDAACDVVVSDGTLNIYTDKYSDYSEEVTAVAGDTYYIRAASTEYSFSVHYYNAEGDGVWVNTDGKYEKVSGGRQSYYYYTVERAAGYAYMDVYAYIAGQTQGKSASYYRSSGQMTPNASYDTIAFSGRGFDWTNYGTVDRGFGGMGGRPGGPGGMNDGNSDKGDHSTKGIKAGNEIVISGGAITVNSYDDALHANNDGTLESGVTPSGNVTVSGGTLTLSSNDDAIHADGKACVSGGTVTVLRSYEGIEGNTVEIAGGNVSVISSDDGLNATTTQGTGITVSGGTLYVLAGGDGVDSNSQTQYSGILFAGGRSVIISTGRADSSIDTERGYKYTGGYVVGIGLSGGMGNESTMCQNFSSVGKKTTLNLASGSYLSVSGIVTVKMPSAMNALVVLLGSTSADISVGGQISGLDGNGVAWEK